MMDSHQHSEKLAALEKALLDESVNPVDLPFSLLMSITENFSEAREIGRGGFGAVYKGVLPSGGIIAVKKLFERTDIPDKNFESEIDCLVGVKHKNMVRFLGYCSETQQVLMPYEGKNVLADMRQRLLCFEYLPKRCLANYLSDASSRLEWATLYQIIKGVCEGVHYLHQQHILHMDLKPENVLLDDNMLPRISYFGLSRRLSESKSRTITKNMIGTRGYMAPEFLDKGEITFKTDIYSLGVIIMEILTRHKGCTNVKEVVESWTTTFRTSENHTTLEQVKVCAEIGIKCREYYPQNRPTTPFIISGILGEADISSWSITSDVATSTERQITFASNLASEVKLMDTAAAPSQLQPSAPEVEQEHGKMSLKRNGKTTAVSVVAGVTSNLSGMAATCMGAYQNKRKEVRTQASFLEKELDTINAAIQHLELMDVLTPVVKNWRDDVREISYDLENCISDFTRQFGGENAEASLIDVVELHKRQCELQRIANQMEELRTLVVDAKARRESYKIDDYKPSFDHAISDPRLTAVYQEATNLVGIDGPKEEVANWLMDTKKKLKVVSVVGFGGLGKTTLAKQVYDKIRGQFNCVAFFSVSQRPNMRDLLNRLQLKLQMKSSHDRGLDDIIEDLREYLANKRYLIVVDDLWDQSAWNTISCAFPENGNGSRIIVTTRVEGVARVACHNDHECIYTMKPLTEHNSRLLFFKRVFGSEVVCPPYPKDIADEILRKCGGLPLAIITIASLLATQRGLRKHWESIRDSLSAQSATTPSLKEVDSILNLSYMHLPLHLRRCFLYLGMYPEDHIIWRDDLIKQWIAEGFVSSLHGPDLEDVGRNYFNELVNRSVIQPSDTKYGEVLSCTVHDLMLDLIIRKCVEDNFISVAYNSEDMARLLHGYKSKVRRLSLSSMVVGGATYDTAIASSLSHVQSFILFRNPIPPLLWFKYLRVLIIANGNERIDLTSISQLFQLRYLKVRVRGKIELPTELGELVYLETLDIANCKLMKSIPSDIVHLPCLSYLVLPDFRDLPKGIESLPEGIENMKSLRTLQGFDLIKSSLKCVLGLGKLTNLRELSMKTSYHLGMPKGDALACSIGKLYNLKCLRISGRHSEHEDNWQLGSLCNPFQHIERLELNQWRLCRVPKWMGGLHCVRFLELEVAATSTKEVHLLGELPSLVHLFFSVGGIADGRAIFRGGLFPVLEFFHFSCGRDTTAYLGFEAGAMPNLQTLYLRVRHWGGTIPVGMEHLLHLEEIRLFGDFDILKPTFEAASLVHPNRPTINSGYMLLAASIASKIGKVQY